MSSKLMHVLKEELSDRKSKNFSYSLRAFARDLGVSATSLSQYLNGKRTLSYKSSLKICERIPLDSETKEEIIKELTNTPAVYRKFSSQTDWTKYAIINILNQPDFALSASEIADRLNLFEEDTKLIVNYLCSVKLLECDQQNRYSLLVDGSDFLNIREKASDVFPKTEFATNQQTPAHGANSPD